MSQDLAPQASITSPRRPTTSEWNSLQNEFPNMQQANIWIIGEPTSTYNCIAWSVNITSQWINLGLTYVDFSLFYLSNYAIPSAPGLANIALYGAGLSDMQHAAREMTIPAQNIGLTWTSKLGAEWLITHQLSDLAGSSYGQTQGYFIKVFSSTPDVAATAMEAKIEGPGIMMPFALTTAQEQYIRTKVNGVDVTVREQFSKAYKAWQDSWSEPKIRFSSRSQDRAQSGEFHTLVMMGPAIVPLLIEKVQQGDTFALLVIERLVHPGIVFQPSETDIARLGGEQWRAHETLIRWILAAG